MQYDPNQFEEKWQKEWLDAKVYRTPTTIEELGDKPKAYVLDMFPYPSGAGLHVGHPEGYTATDIICRYKRAQGFNVLHPMGWDAFGLNAERAAVREDIHPAKITVRNVDTFRQQLQRLGFSYDWERELSTTDVDYYKWTQWIFLKLHEKGLAYLAEVPVNWCPALSTVLANEEVKDGKYVETGDPVERRNMKQWMLKITEYGDRLLEDLDELDWSESVKEMQRNWIGKSEGARVHFTVKKIKDSPVSDSDKKFEIYTTRPDTLFGATYCVLAPEHPLVAEITSADQKSAVDDYVNTAKNKSDMDRTDDRAEKTGVFTGAFAINPVNGKDIPIWVADYVLISYGTGAIMAVPGHDERDHAFATKFEIPILEVVSGGKKPITEEAYTDNTEGKLVNSDFLDGLKVPEAKAKIIAWLEEKGIGTAETQYKLRDWLFSRQRYWGEPFPVVHFEDGTVDVLPESELPVEHPNVDEFKPTADGQPPLARAGDDWLMVELPDGRKGVRETNTMPQWAGSCWYYLRYIDPKNSNEIVNKDLEKYWMPVDLYVGGVEHAVLHLLYARFWHKVLYDLGYVSTKEPFQKLYNQGMILAFSYQNKAGKYFHPSEVNTEGKTPVHKESGEELIQQVEKMSKSKLNVVNPNDVVAEYGADSLRLYEMFMGPLDQVKPWKTDSVEGVYRFLGRVWRLIVDESTDEMNSKLTDAPGSSEPELWKTLHKTIKKVQKDIESLSFNTAISQMMIFTNDATKATTLPRETVEMFLKTLSPFAPHIAEELWSRMGNEGFIVQQDWPQFDDSLCQENEVTVVVMVNGKKRGEMKVAMGTDKAELEAKAKEAAGVAQHIEGKSFKKVIVVPNKLVNFVVG